MSFDTKAFLRLRVSQVPWLFSSGPPLLDVLHTTPLKAIPCHARLAIFRWLIDSEPDLHFRLRPFLSRSSPCICGCGLLSSIYPFGLRRGAFHSSHLHFDLLYTLAFSSLPDDSLSPLPTFMHPPLSLMETPPQWHFSLICPKHLKGLTRTGSLNFSGSKEHRDGCMHMRNLFSFTAGSRTKCKVGSCPVEQSGKGSTWGGPSQCTFSAWLWTLCSPT